MDNEKLLALRESIKEINLSTPEGKALITMLDVIAEMQEKINEYEERFGENEMRLDELEGEFDGDDFTFDDDDGIYEVECPKCQETLTVDINVVNDGTVKCVNCGTLIEFEIEDECGCGCDECSNCESEE